MAANFNTQFSDYRNKYNFFKDNEIPSVSSFLEKFIYYNDVNNIMTLNYFD
jgi:hypothetical protein